MPLFVVFEGGEGSGKSTQARALYRQLRRIGVASTLTRDPGGTALGRKTERLLKQSPGLSPATELLLFAASRSLLTASVIRPALLAGMAVVCDRYSPSTTAYQGYGRGLDLKVVAEVNNLATGGLQPDVTVLLDIPPEQGLARKASAAADRFQGEDTAFHQRVREGYLAMAAAETQRWLVLDATLPRPTLSTAVWHRVSRLLGQEGRR
ncbi:MAG: dTMP kinase [Chloroflexota bacterium]